MQRFGTPSRRLAAGFLFVHRAEAGAPLRYAGADGYNPDMPDMHTAPEEAFHGVSDDARPLVPGCRRDIGRLGIVLAVLFFIKGGKVHIEWPRNDDDDVIDVEAHRHED